MIDPSVSIALSVAAFNLIGLLFIGRAQQRIGADIKDIKTLAEKTEKNKEELVNVTRSEALLQGAHNERMAVDAQKIAEVAGSALPIPVTDSRAADAAEKSADALGRLADATEKGPTGGIAEAVTAQTEAVTAQTVAVTQQIAAAAETVDAADKTVKAASRTMEAIKELKP